MYVTERLVDVWNFMMQSEKCVAIYQAKNKPECKKFGFRKTLKRF